MTKDEAIDKLNKHLSEIFPFPSADVIGKKFVFFSKLQSEQDVSRVVLFGNITALSFSSEYGGVQLSITNGWLNEEMKIVALYKHFSDDEVEDEIQSTWRLLLKNTTNGTPLYEKGELVFLD